MNNIQAKLNPFFSTTPLRSIRKAEATLHAFLISALDGDEWLADV
jgi:hypothetical protein